MTNKILLISLLSALSFGVLAQTCNQHIPDNTSNLRFIDNGDGTVTDVVNLTIWDKCSVGQQYEEGKCNGAPDHFETWQEALIYASEQDARRLPNIKELGSLVNRKCLEPAINGEIFPDTPLAVYWSNTPSNEVNEGLIIDFTDGTEVVRDVNRQRYIRLVVTQ